MSKMITKNQELSNFSRMTKYTMACCSLAVFLLLSGTSWAQTCYYLSLGGGSYAYENSWEIIDGTGVSVADGDGAVNALEVCLFDECYTLNMFDSWGDGWNGNVVTIVNAASEVVAGPFTLASGSFGSVDFALGSGVCTTDCEAGNFGDACPLQSGGSGILDENCDCVAAICLNEDLYPFAIQIPNQNGNVTQINSCQYWTEYTEIGGIESGFEYEFTSVMSQTNGYITVRDGAIDGSVVASGYSPLTITAASSSNLFVHWTADEICTTETSCATTTVSCISCASIPDCAGVPGGSAQPGTACDDGDAGTINDLYDADCNCAGDPPSEASLCEIAIPIECNADPVTYSSVGSNGVNTTACSMGSKGLWFSFVGTGGDITVNSTASFDHRLSVNVGECSDLTSIVCRDLSTGAENHTIPSSVLGATYYVYIAHYNSTSSTTGNITIDIDCATPPACVSPELSLSAQDIAGAPIDGCLEAGTSYYVLAALTGGEGNDSYNVTANGGTAVEVDANGSVVLGPFSVGANVSVVATGAQDDDCDVSASINSPAVCAPANDDCIDAIAIACGETLAGTTVGATISNMGLPSCAFGTPADVFYTLEAVPGVEYTITVNGSDYDGVLAIYSGSCDGLTQEACADNGFSAGVAETIEFSVDEATTITIRTYDWSSNRGDFTISVSCEQIFECPQYEANIGDACDDGNDSTENDVLDANCGCAGTPVVVFDCPQYEANVGDACDDGDDSTENDVLDANCGCAGAPVSVFDCPDLEANIGEPCNDGNDATENDVLIEDCTCAGTPFTAPVCDDFVYYISDHSAVDGISDIYAVTLSGGVATMEYIATSDIEIHIAYNSVDNLIYAVSKHENSYRTLNPHIVAPSFGPTIALGADYGELTAAVFNADGKLLIGSQDHNAIYSVNVISNVVSSYDTYAPVTGGDLAFASDGMLYLATRSGNGLYEVYPADVTPDILIGSVTSKVTGLAITSSDQLLVTNQGNTSLEVRNLDGSNPGTTFVLTLNGEPYTLRDGDMASGCNTFDQPNVGECLNYKLYYVHTPSGGGHKPLLEVTLHGDGTASSTTIIANIGGHIGLSPDGSIIYNVQNSLKVIDVASATVITTMNITKPGGGNLTGIPAVVVGSDGTLYVAKGNQVYTVDTSTGAATPYGPNRTVSGGDLIEIDGEIWLITRNNNTFTNVLTGDSFSVPVTEINGAAVLANGNVLVADGNGGSLLKEIDMATQSVVGTYDIGLALHDGDLAGACIQSGGLSTGCFGFEILEFNQGLQTNGLAVHADRSDANAALGQPDASNAPGGFVSLGVGGSITIGFSGVVYDAPGNDIRIWETSFSGDVCGAGDDESADIELSQNGINFVSVGSICRDGEVDIAGTGLEYVSAIRITNSASTGTSDGYDVDGIEAINGCSAPPVIEEGDCYATEVVEYVQGLSSNGGAIAANRTDVSKALGAPERVDQVVFVSLGYGGSITLAFDGAIPNGEGDDIEIVETTFGNSSCASYAEFADVYVSVDGDNFFFAKTVCRADGFVDISDAGAFAYVNFVRIVNNNDLSTTPDAFDVDGVVALHNCEDDQVTPGFVPVQTAHLSSFPNPTAGVSQVVFVAGEAGHALVEVYDMSGRNIATLFNAEAQNGVEYTLDFDGAALPNGVYIYKMSTNNESIIEKFMIAK